VLIDNVDIAGGLWVQGKSPGTCPLADVNYMSFYANDAETISDRPMFAVELDAESMSLLQRMNTSEIGSFVQSELLKQSMETVEQVSLGLKSQLSTFTENIAGSVTETVKNAGVGGLESASLVGKLTEMTDSVMGPGSMRNMFQNVTSVVSERLNDIQKISDASGNPASQTAVDNVKTYIEKSFDTLAGLLQETGLDSSSLSQLVEASSGTSAFGDSPMNTSPPDSPTQGGSEDMVGALDTPKRLFGFGNKFIDREIQILNAIWDGRALEHHLEPSYYLALQRTLFNAQMDILEGDINKDSA
jgi:hypothetical protein